MATGKRLLAGAGWTYGSQLTIVVLQFAYAAITSRTLNSSAFGAYAIALSVTSLITLLSTAGLGQTAGRMESVENKRTEALATYALILGTIGAAFTYVTAWFWTNLWSAPEALGTVQLFSIGAFIAPALGLVQGLGQRLGKFRALALISLTANVLGMGVGVLLVIWLRVPEALVVFPLATQVICLIASWTLVKDVLRRFGRVGHAKDDVAFSWKLTVSSVMAYGVGNILRIATSRILGVSALGQWNRAEVLSSVPFQQAQAAMISAIYPEFRHDIQNSNRAGRVWSDLLALVAWCVLPIGALGATLTPYAIPIIFGPGWDLAAQIAPVLCIAGALQIFTTLLASAVEALGKFRWVWFTQCLLLVLQVVGVALIVVFPTIWVPIFALIATNILRHGVHIVLCARAGYIRPLYLIRAYGQALLFSAAVALVARGTTTAIDLALVGSAWWSLAAVAIAGVPTAILLVFRNRFPPVALGQKYGLLR